MAVAAEKNSTLVLPIPVELLRFLERGAQPPAENSGHAESPGPAESSGHAGTADRAEITERAVDRTDQAEDAMEKLRRAVEQ
jgi:hypothetical protein